MSFNKAIVSDQRVRGIVSNGMDGSDLKVIVENMSAEAITVDQDSASLYWALGVSISESNTLFMIMCSDLNGKKVRKVVVTERDSNLLGLRVVGDWLYWWDSTHSRSHVRLHMCNKRSGNDLAKYVTKNAQKGVSEWEVPFLYLILPHPPKSKSPCSSGKLCSHVCSLTPNRYMRCLCPVGYTLLPDGWNCGK